MAENRPINRLLKPWVHPTKSAFGKALAILAGLAAAPDPVPARLAKNASPMAIQVTPLAFRAQT